jgi:hypothetical protein
MLAAVSGSSQDDVWAVGEDLRSETAQVAPVVLHWNGHAWRQVLTPTRKFGEVGLNDVVARSPGNVWVVGNGFDTSGVAAHWNGRHWRIFALPGPANTESLDLNAVTAVNAHDIRVVATANMGAGYLTGASLGLTYRWNGSRWIRRLGELGNSFASYDAVAALSSKEVWIANNYSFPVQQPPGSELFTPLHAKGKQIQLPDGNVIHSLATVAQTVWGVGSATSGHHVRPLVERFGC